MADQGNRAAPHPPAGPCCPAALLSCCPAVLPKSPIPRRPTRRWEVEVTDLAAPADGASLFVGEFVEYLPSAAQQAVEAARRRGPARSGRRGGCVA